MWKLKIIVVAVFTVLAPSETYVPPAGKCDTANIETRSVPIEEVELHSKWKVMYATDLGHNMDHEYYYMTVLSPKNYHMENRRVLKNKTVLTYKFGMRYVDDVFIEEIKIGEGVPHRFYGNPLGVTHSLAMLIYRCSEVGSPGEYMRFIVVPVDSEPSESEIQQLLAVDRAFFGDSHGNLTKLPGLLKE